MPEDISTLGFQFTYGDSVGKLSTLNALLEKLEKTASRVKPAAEELFSQSFLARVDEVSRIFGKTTGGFTRITESISVMKKSINPVIHRLEKISNLKPVSESTITSFERLARTIRDIYSTGGNKLNVSAPKVSTGGSVGGMGVSAPQEMTAAMIKLNQHTDAFYSKINRIAQSGAWAMIFKQAAAEAVKFGVELAHINSLSMEYDPEKLRSGLLNISSVFGSSAKMAKAEYYAYSSGVRGTEQDLTNFTAQMAKTATLIRASVIPTVDAATTAMNAYGVSAKNASELSDLFYMIVKQGKAKGEQLASGLGQVISTSATAGLSLNEMGASVASLTKVMQTRNAITYLNNMLAKMLKPTKESRLAAQDLGIELGLDAIRASGFANKMQEIHDKTKGSQEALLRIFPDLRGQRAALQLLNKGWGDFQYQLKMFEHKSGTADEALKVLTDDVNFQLASVPESFRKIKIATGEFLTQVFTVNGALSPAIAAFNSMEVATQKVLGSIVALAGGYTMLRGGVAAYQAYQAMTIRNSQVIAAAKAKEAAAAMALVNSLNAESAARAKNTAVSAVSAGELAAKRAALYTDALNWKNGNPAAQKLLQNLKANALAMQTAAAVSGMSGNDRRGNWLKDTLNIQNGKTGRAGNYQAAAQDEYRYAAAIGDAVGAQRAMNRMKAIERSMILADTASRQAESRLLVFQNALYTARTAELKKQNALYKAQMVLQKSKAAFTGTEAGGSIFGAFASGNGFWGGMGRSGAKALKDWGKALTYAKSATSGMTVLSKSLNLMGNGIGKLAGVALSVLSPANLMIGGIAAVALGGADLLFNEGKVIKSLGKKIYNFFTGAFDEIENTRKRLEALDKYDVFRAGFKDFASGMPDWANSMTGNDVVKNTQDAAKKQTQYREALAKLNSAEMQQTKADLAALIREGDKLAAKVRGGFNLSKTVDEANKKFGAQVKIGQGNKLIARQEVVAGPNGGYVMNNAADAQAIAYVEKQKKAHKEYAVRMAEIQDLAAPLQEKISKAQDAVKRSGGALLKFYQSGMNAMQEIVQNLSAVKFSMLTPEQQNAQQRQDLSRYEQQYYDARKTGDYSMQKSAVDGMIKAYDAVQNYAKKQIENGRRLIESLEDDIYDMDMDFETNPQTRRQNAMSRANDILKQAGVSSDAGTWNFGPDLDKSYNAVKKSFNLQIAEQQKQVQNAEQLAQAERQANDNTVRLIQSMDKYKSTAMDAVQANSVDALKLQSRSFTAMPKFNPISTVAQQGYGKEQSELDVLKQDMRNALEQLKGVAQDRTNKAQTESGSLETAMKNFIAKAEEELKVLQEALKGEQKQIMDDAKKQDAVFSALQESSAKTANNTGTVAKAFENMATL